VEIRKVKEMYEAELKTAKTHLAKMKEERDLLAIQLKESDEIRSREGDIVQKKEQEIKNLQGKLEDSIKIGDVQKQGPKQKPRASEVVGKVYSIAMINLAKLISRRGSCQVQNLSL
jgi:hypothetical protein